MKNKINTLQELQREKELLRTKMQLTQSAFKMSLRNNRREVQRLLLNKVALPVGAGALVSLAVKALSKEKDPEVLAMQAEVETKGTPWWVPLARRVMEMISVFLQQYDPAGDSPLAPRENGQEVPNVNPDEI